MVNNSITGSHRSKIGALQDPSQETIDYAKSLNLHELGPGDLATSEWETAGLELPDLPAIREYRIGRIRSQLKKMGYAGIVLFDPLNIRYATDSTNMQLWITHNAARYCFVAAEGPCIVFDYVNTEFLSSHSHVVDEVRPARGWYYFGVGDRVQEMAGKWAAEIADLVKTYGGGNTKLALDRCNPEGLRELEGVHGLEVKNGEEVMELARLIKCDDEIKAMRCAIHACEQSMEVMRTHMHPGVSEQRLWSYLHAENIARGGEWIETRLMASGPRCNPWFQECSSRIIEKGDFVAFDTDLIGSYGICVDISRTWICGGVKPTAEQQTLYDQAYEQIQRNMAWLKPGLTYEQLTKESFMYDRNEFRHYSCLYHGVGLCDESPCIYFPHAWESDGYNGVLEAGMVICVESYHGKRSGGPGVKLEEQVLITKDGYELLSHYPLKEILTN